MWTGHHKWDFAVAAASIHRMIVFPLIAGQQLPKNSNATKSTGLKNQPGPSILC